MAESRRFKVEGAVPFLASDAKNIATVAGAAGNAARSMVWHQEQKIRQSDS